MKITKYLAAGLASVMLAVVLVAAPSFAAPGGPTPNPTSPPEGPPPSRAEQAEENRLQAQQRAEERRETAKQRVARIKQTVEERKAEIKQRVCEKRQDVLQRNIPRMASGATNVKKAFDTIYERVQGFYDSGQLTVENYDELTASIDVAQAEAAAAVTAAENFSFELDCEDPDVATQLDSFRLAVTEAKDSLKVYRDELVDLISAMRAEAGVENSQNGAGDQTDAKPEEESNEG